MASVKECVRTHVRWMIRRDLPEVLAIERASFPHPWTEKDILRVLADRSCIGGVAEHNDRILGFMLYRLHHAYVEVLNFAVHPDCRLRGVGTQMVAKLKEKLSSYRRTAIELVTGEWNLGSHLFFKACGFWCEGVSPGHYADTGEDGYDFAYRLPEGTL
jgi:[ribosomal protein S18]-alanine N-acetyltransferase